MDFGRSFTYFTADEEWIKKFAIAAVCALLPIIGTIPLFGYQVAIIREKLHGGASALPEWDFGQAFKDGIFAIIIGIVYALPMILLFICAGGAGFGLAATGDETMVTAGLVVGGCLACLALIVGVVTGLATPMALARYADVGEIGPAFRVGEIIALVRNNIGGLLIVVIGYGLVLSIIISIGGSIGLILCGIGPFIAIAYAAIVISDGIAQVYQKAQ